MRHALAALVLALGALFAACETSPEYDPMWESTEVSAPSERLLLQVISLALGKEGFPVGSGVDPTEGSILTGWRTSLQPFRGEGRRDRAEVWYERLDSGRFRVEARIEREVNNDVLRPMDPTYAEWKAAPDDDTGARILLQRIRSWLREELELEPEVDPIERALGRDPERDSGR